MSPSKRIVYSRYYTIFIVCAAIVSTAYVIFKLIDETKQQKAAQTEQTVEPRSTASTPNGIGTKADPIARIRYETMRLVDPVTGKVPDNIRSKELEFAKTLPQKNEGARGSNWTHRGPRNVGGRTRAVALDVLDENTILAGGVTGGLWRSTDGGASFAKMTNPDQLHSVTSIAQDRRAGKENTWYYGTGEYYAIVSAASFSSRASGNGIFKSTDNGQSWTLLESTASNTPTTLYQPADFDFVWRIVTDHTNLVDDVVLAAVYNGIYRSADGGISWQPVLGLDTTIAQQSAFTDILITPNGVLYAVLSHPGPDKGIWRSTDGGIIWTEISPDSWPNSFRRTTMAYAPSDENQLYFISHTPGSGLHDHNLWKYTYLSGNGDSTGGMWENRSQNLPTNPCEVFYDFEFGNYNSQSAYDMCIAVKPDDPDVVFLGGTNVYRSEDGFTTPTSEWIGGYRCDTITPSDYIWRNHHPDQHYFIFLPSDDDVMITANDGGLYKTPNCMAAPITWESLNNGYVTSQFYTVAIEEGWATNDIMVGGTQDNGTSWTNSESIDDDWEWVFYGDGAYCAIPEGRENYYLSWQTGKTFKFEIDDNGNVLGLTRIDPALAGGHLFINPFILDKSDQNIMYMTIGRYIWRNDSLDAIPITGNEYDPIEQGWQRLQESYIGFDIQQPSISCLDISLEPSHILYYGTSVGGMFRLDDAHSTEPVRTDIKNGLPNGYVSSVAVDPMNADKVIVTFSNYNIQSVFLTEDGGQTWQSISGNLEENPDGTGNGPATFWANIYNTGDTSIYYVGTSVGLFSTSTLDGDNTVWEQEGAGTIGNVVINMIKSRISDGLVAVATHGNGIYSTRLNTISSISENPHPEMEVNIFPNPFADEVTIQYNLETVGEIKIEVFDLAGKMVATLLNQKQSGGQHSVKWNGKNNSENFAADGIYLIKVGFDGQQNLTERVVFQR